jgi:hypothetical protein
MIEFFSFEPKLKTLFLEGECSEQLPQKPRTITERLSHQNRKDQQ